MRLQMRLLVVAIVALSALAALAALAGCRAYGGSRAESRLPNLPAITPRRALAAAQLDGRLYALGGWNGEATQLDLLEVLDPGGPAWQAGPRLQAARSQHALVAVSGRLWAIGGWSAADGLVAAVEALDPAGGDWQLITHLPTPRREPGAARLGSEIVVAGGFDGQSDADIDGYLDVVEAFDPERGTWRQLPRLSEPRRGLALVNSGERLYAIGGYNAEHGFVSRVERYDPAGKGWVTLDWPVEARTWTAALALDGAILIAGGYNRQGFLGLVERVDPAAGSVCHPPALQTPRAWLAGAAYQDGLLTLGGETPAGFSGAVEWMDGRCR